MTNQQGDVLLFQTDNDGDINVENGTVEMAGGLETAAYLSIFGGNEQDDGRESNVNNWWGNINEPSESGKYRSETQFVLKFLPATSSNIKKLKDAVLRDLQWFLRENIASKVDISVSLPALNSVKIVIDIQAEGDESRFEFVENWRSTL